MITFTSPYGSVTLPNPQLGDTEQHNIFTKFAVSMSKKVHSVKMTPSHSKYLLTIINVDQTEYGNFRTWFINSRGFVHTYTDYNSVAHIGIITNEPLEIVPNAISLWSATSSYAANVEVASLNIEFEEVN